jgi:hypothetical protein
MERGKNISKLRHFDMERFLSKLDEILRKKQS